MTFFIALDQRLQAILSKTNTRMSVFFALTWTLNILLLIHYPDSKVNGVTVQVHKLVYTGVGRRHTLVILTDIFCKTIVVGIKGVLAVIPGTWVGLKRKRRLFQSMEYSLQLHRVILPTPRLSIDFIGSAGYAGMHYLNLFLLICNWVAKLCTRLVHIGEDRGGEFDERSEAKPRRNPRLRITMLNMLFGFEDTIELVCAHIFCVECVDRWLEMKHTCPLCCATIDKEDKSGKVTSKFVRVY